MFVLFCFIILASWLFGFLASWLLGFLAFRLLVGLCGFLALAFCILCIPSFSPAGGVLAFAAFRCGFWWLWLFTSSAFPVLLRAFWFLHPFIVFGFSFAEI